MAQASDSSAQTAQGGTYTTVQSDTIDLYTENYTPTAGEGFVACSAQFDWIATTQ